MFQKLRQKYLRDKLKLTRLSQEEEQELASLGLSKDDTLENPEFLANIAMETWSSIFKRNKNFKINSTLSKRDGNVIISRATLTDASGEAVGNEKRLLVFFDNPDAQRYYDMINREPLLEAVKVTKHGKEAFIVQKDFKRLDYYKRKSDGTRKTT